jgi:HPt (histidine-containing phosphotransfer) domain-containing protein
MRKHEGPILNEATLADVVAIGGDMLEEIIALFADDVPGRIARLHEAFDARVADAIRREAHGLKGGALSIGAARMASICQAIEHHAAAGHIDEAAALEDAVEPAFDEACRALDAFCRCQTL